MHRFATAAPSGLMHRLVRPHPASVAGPTAALRGLASLSDAEAPKYTIRRIPVGKKLPKGSDGRKQPEKSAAPRTEPTAAAKTKTLPHTPSILRQALIKDNGESNPKVTGRLSSVRIGNGAYSGQVMLGFEGINDYVNVSSLWLRDNCTCPQCVTPSSGQKTFYTHDVASVEIKDMPDPDQIFSNDDTAIRIVWTTKSSASQDSDASTEMPEQEHVSVYDAKILLQTVAEYHVAQYPLDLPRRLWDRRTIEEALKPVSYADWMAPDNGNNADFYRGLLDLYQLGILIVDGVPDSENAVREIARQIGTIQTTFYGELFDVVSKPNAENVAYTNVFLGLHQDLLYMNDPPYIQLLHCLRNECDGGESLFCDSVRVAVEMQLEEPEHTKALSTRPVAYHYERNGHYYYNKRPVFELDGSRDTSRAIVKHTAWSPPFQDSFRNPAHLGWELRRSDHLKQIGGFYKWAAAAKAFNDRLEHPDNMLEVKLQAGQCVLFNNRRVLHGRRQFNTTKGTRWLKGTYVGEQTFHSRVTDMLRRGVNGTAPVYGYTDSVRLSEQKQVLDLARPRLEE
ncbi:hypothetical protein SEPCBS119000_000543 [Sporothrix epigloea]|uniref:Gamma-butyrobetaine dioxygenase n=1 Tax=Sporothrix epigloea TaxID=1892477 RepID=A0ABP0D5Q9_9PEZI